MPMSAEQRQAMARQAGFPSYEAMLAWENQRQNKRGGSVLVKGAAPVRAERPVPEKVREDAPSWHPASIFNYITSALRGANEK